MLKTNMHIHSKYSWDSEMEIEDIAKMLSENGIEYGAITDHVEFDREPLDYVIEKLKIRNLEIDMINDLYQGKITSLKAVEISETHLYKKEVEALNELDLDFLMGSIHKIDKQAISKGEMKHSTYLYYKEILKMVETSSVDVIGHLDYINRYYGKDYSSRYQIDEVLKAIIENQKIIEINTSGARRMGTNTFPSFLKICLYSLKQKEIVIGTDAHRYGELLDNLEQAEIIVNAMDLKPTIYQKRKRIIL